MTKYEFSRRKALIGIGGSMAAIACGSSSDSDDATQSGGQSVDGEGGGGGGAAGTPGTSPFIEMVPSSLAAVPGGAGFGMDCGYGSRDGKSAHATPPTLYLVNRGAADPIVPVDRGVYEGGLAAALSHDVDNKVILLVRSGLYDALTADSTYGGFEIMGNNVSVVGHTVRADLGAVLKQRGFLARGGNTHVMGLRLYVDDKDGFAEPYGSNRGITMGFGSELTTRLLVSGCECLYGTDQTLNFGFVNSETTSVGLECGVWETAICYALNYSIHEIDDGDPNSGFGPHSCGSFIDHTVDKFSMQRCLLAHNASRNPFLASRVSTICNNLFYNWGSSSPDFFSQCIYLLNHPSDQTPAPLLALIARNLFLAGPNGYATPVIAQDSITIDGAAIRIVDNREFGLGLGSQIDYGDPDAQAVLTDMSPSECLFDGLDPDAANIDEITDSLEGHLAYVDKFLRGCGVQPKTRTIGVVPPIIAQMEAFRSEAGGDYGAVVDTSDQGGGYPTPEEFAIDPNNPTHVSEYWGGHSLPGSDERHAIQSNGRTGLENWVEQIRRLHYGG
jgi:hypothetical protein